MLGIGAFEWEAGGELDCCPDERQEVACVEPAPGAVAISSGLSAKVRPFFGLPGHLVTVWRNPTVAKADSMVEGALHSAVEVVTGQRTAEKRLVGGRISR